ncbi:MAG: phosphate ABC transporter permease subunit PstC [Acidimicrobiia bacterium]
MTDRLFEYVALLAGLMVLVILALILFSTTQKAWPWFQEEGLGIFANDWVPSQGKFGAGALIYGTFLVGFLALLMAVPVSVGIALFVTEIAPRRLAKPVVYVVDLLAAIPSVVYGLWAIFVLMEPLSNLFADVSSATEGIPILDTIFANPSATGRSYMTAGIIVAIMITPIVTSITREVFATTPQPLKEAAIGMGATRWEMIKGAVFPHSRGGVVAAVMIGLGRAIGETIAVALVIGSSQRISAEILGPGDTMASVIVNEFGEAQGTHRAALIGLGVVLFVLTVLVGMTARALVTHFDKRAGIVTR